MRAGGAGVIYVARADGVLEVWDLLDRSNEPSMTAAPCTTPITYLAFSPAGAPAAPGGRSVQQLLAVGEFALTWALSCSCSAALARVTRLADQSPHQDGSESGCDYMSMD